MSELQFSRTEIEGLAQKLDSPQSQLSEREKQLLLAIFSAARDQVRSSGPETSGEAEVTLTNLRERLLNSFIPGDGAEFIMGVPNIEPPP